MARDFTFLFPVMPPVPMVSRIVLFPRRGHLDLLRAWRVFRARFSMLSAPPRVLVWTRCTGFPS